MPRPLRTTACDPEAVLLEGTLDEDSGFTSNDRVIQAVARQAFVAIDAGAPERCVFIATECEHGLVHLFGVKHLELDQQMEVLHHDARNGAKEIRLNLCNDVLKRVLRRWRADPSARFSDA